MDAARMLAEEKGFDSMSIRDICAETGFSIGAFYHHFSSKDDLLNESFKYFDDTITPEAVERYDNMQPLEAVKAVLIDQTDFTEDIGVALMREYYRALLQQSGQSAIDPQRGYYQTVRIYVEKAQQQQQLSDILSADELAGYLIKLVRGCLVDWCLHDGNYPVTERTQQEVDFFLLPFVAESR